MNCPNCGKLLEPGSSFCNVCGSKTDKDPIETQNENVQNSLEIPQISNNQSDIKSQANPKQPKKNHTVIYILLGICAVITAIKGYTAYVEHQVSDSLQEYYEKEMLPAKIGEDYANGFNNHMPKPFAPGIMMEKCEAQGKELIYTLVCEGVSPADANALDKTQMKEQLLTALKQQASENPEVMQINKDFAKYGYKHIYRFSNDKAESLFDLNIAPEEIIEQ